MVGLDVVDVPVELPLSVVEVIFSVVVSGRTDNNVVVRWDVRGVVDTVVVVGSVVGTVIVVVVVLRDVVVAFVVVDVIPVVVVV